MVAPCAVVDRSGQRRLLELRYVGPAPVIGRLHVREPASEPLHGVRSASRRDLHSDDSPTVRRKLCAGFGSHEQAFRRVLVLQQREHLGQPHAGQDEEEPSTFDAARLARQYSRNECSGDEQQRQTEADGGGQGYSAPAAGLDRVPRVADHADRASEVIALCPGLSPRPARPFAEVAIYQQDLAFHRPMIAPDAAATSQKLRARLRAEPAVERRNPRKREGSGGGRYWARTSDLRLVEAALSQLS
jgi:hypothetical protein